MVSARAHQRNGGTRWKLESIKPSFQQKPRAHQTDLGIDLRRSRVQTHRLVRTISSSRCHDHVYKATTMTDIRVRAPDKTPNTNKSTVWINTGRRQYKDILQTMRAKIVQDAIRV